MPERPPDILGAHAAAQPDKPALIEDHSDGRTTVWSFDELNRQAHRLGNALLGLGVRPGQTVVWCGMNSLGVVRMMHAARKIGVTSVPLNYRLAPEEAAYIVGDCGAVAVYADADYAELFAEIRPELLQLEHVLIYGGAPGPDMHDAEELVAAARDARPEVDAASASDSTMIYTSGTTGRPKGAVRSALGDPDLTRQLLAFIGYQPDDVYLTTGPLYHSGPGGFLSIAHALGNTVVLQRKFDAEDWLRLVDRHCVTTTFSAPTPIRVVTQLPAETKARYDRSSMRRMVANAAPWSLALKQAYLADFPDDSLWEVYGSTELGVDTILRPEDQLRKPGSCGRAAPGVEIALFDDAGNAIEAVEVPGELYVRSKSDFETYHNAQE